MALPLVGIDQAGACVECEGGIVRAAGVPCADIDLATITFDAAGGVTNIAAVIGGANVAKYIFDDDDSAFANSLGERVGANAHRSNKEAFMKFECVDEAKMQEANAIADNGCCMIWVYEWANGVQTIDGVDAIDDGLGGLKAVFSKTKAKPTINVMSDVGNAADRIEVAINSVSRQPILWLARASFTIDDFIAL